MRNKNQTNRERTKNSSASTSESLSAPIINDTTHLRRWIESLVGILAANECVVSSTTLTCIRNRRFEFQPFILHLE
jgi:hypothetical protein